MALIKNKNMKLSTETCTNIMMEINTLDNGINLYYYFNRIIGTQAKQGKGICISKNGEKREGWYRNNKRNGKGRSIQLTGNTYEGQYKNDKFNGLGEYTWLAGETYKGEWNNNKRDGAGIKRSADGEITQQGRWKDDVFIGK